MLKISLFAAAVVLASGGVGLADDMRAQDSYGYYGHGYRQSDPNAAIGVNRYCGPGEIPEPFPNGNGIRCELPSGGYRYF